MLLHNLHEDILAIVLRRCGRFRDEPVRDLKSNLPLLAVCRLWRRLAIPSVYRHVLIQYGDERRHRGGSFTRNSNAEEPADVAIKTNLDLIDMVGCASAVKQVRIVVYCSANPLPGSREVIQRMRAVASKWRILELRVSVHPGFPHFDSRSVDIAESREDIAEVGGALAALMPSVRSLECGTGHDPIAGSLCGRLASHYADQLKRLICHRPITVPMDCRFAKLKKFSINFDKVADNRLPHIAGGELVDVTLIKVPPNHSWASFRANSDSHVVEFTKLRKLYVDYRGIHLKDGVPVRHRDGHPWKLHLPSLEWLNIQCPQDICPLLEYAVLPPCMEYIYIEMKSTTYQEVADLVLPATKRLSLCIGPDSRGDPSGLPAINRILESARGSESRELVIRDRMLRVGPESITCTALTHLLALAPTSVDTMLAIIGRLPNLVKLTLFDLDLSGTQADLSIPDANDGTVVEPLSLSLEELSIMYNRRHSANSAVAMVKYVLLRTPKLIGISASQIPTGPVVHFVEAYASRYPHLSSVKLQLYDDRGSADCRQGFSLRC